MGGSILAHHLSQPHANRPYCPNQPICPVCCLLCRSAALANGLGWSKPLSGSVLAHQLSQLGALHTHVTDAALARQLAGVVPALYGGLAALGAEELGLVRAVLQGAPCVWVGNGFAPPERVAFKVGADCAVFMLSVVPVH